MVQYRKEHEMARFFNLSIQTFLFIGIVLGGCTQSQETAQTTSTPSPAPPPQAAPPPPRQPEQLTLYTIPRNPADFSMQAIQAFKKRAEENPGDAEALVGLGDANFMISRFDVSKDYYEKAIAVDQGRVDAYIGLSNTYLQLQRPEDSIRQLDYLLKANEDYAHALYNKGLILLMALHDTEGAKKSWSKLLEKHPDYERAMKIRGELESM